MTINETPSQKRANEFDAKLFGLLYRAIDFSADPTMTKAERHSWDAIRMRIAEARPFVRKMMHPDRVKETDMPA